MSALTTGFYGKLPSHGDFIIRELSADVITVWDEWLQSFVGSSRELLGEAWLETYLASPVWRFVLSKGCIDDSNWAGVWLPSVDRVGRYFPFTILVQLPERTSIAEFITSQTEWFGNLERIALDALDGHIDADSIIDAVDEIETTQRQLYDLADPSGGQFGNCINLVGDNYQQSLAVLSESLLMQSGANSYSLWSSQGSDQVEPALVTASGLPPVRQLPALLDGLWSHWQWQQAFQVR